MKDKQESIDRRSFLKAVGAAGLGSVLASPDTIGASKETPDAQEPELPQVPKRKLGKTGVEIPVLSLGTMFNLVDSQLVLRSTLKYGVTYWDTANVYAGGNSELGIGKFLEKNPQMRNQLFIVTKAKRAYTKDAMEKCLQLSLDRMKTDHVDLHYFHDLQDPALLTDEIRKYAESAKKRKLIRFFGLTTHSNIPKCLLAGAKLDWIDVIMTRYNFRTMQDPQMQAAIDACHRANIGLVAMKTTGKTTIKRFKKAIETEAEKKMVEHFLNRGFTPEQACIKLALQDKRFSSACVQMENVNILKTNVAAVLDKTELTRQDMDILAEYAQLTSGSYCAGCAHICDAALPETLRPGRICDIMRYLMYHNSYGDSAAARDLFAQIPSRVRSTLLSIDYDPAEARCPQRLPIRKLVAEAVTKLA